MATNDEILNGYARSLRSEGVEETEIARRIHLLREERPLLDADRYNRIYTSGNAPFNRAPNAFVMESLRGKRPGVVLDYAMGEGRNSIYLAQLGWEVWGFDPADAAVELAQRRARALGLTLHAEAVADSEFEFGHERFDVIVFSWAMPLIPVETVLGSLKPGGVVVMEAAADYVGRNGMLQMFDALRILKYEIVRDTADWYDRRQTEIVRLIAVKP
ncbi:MAG: methyltransferase domain-containing protein [Acidobacteria bacterium]|nr:methyltransferase domain-containing protein [Acidobacteriota bacterium]